MVWGARQRGKIPALVLENNTRAKGLEKAKIRDKFWRSLIESGEYATPWYSSRKDQHAYLGLPKPLGYKNRWVNWAAPYRRLDTPIYGSNYTYISKVRPVAFDYQNPLVKGFGGSKRRRHRMRRPLVPDERSKTRRERLLRNAIYLGG